VEIRAADAHGGYAHQLLTGTGDGLGLVDKAQIARAEQPE
jgi:hypothetical protein